MSTPIHPNPWSHMDPRARSFRPMRLQPTPNSSSYSYHHRIMPSAPPLTRHISPTPTQYPLIYSPDSSSPYASHMPSSSTSAPPQGDQLMDYFDPMSEMEASKHPLPYDQGFYETGVLGWGDRHSASSLELSHDEKMRLVGSAASPRASFAPGGMSPSHVKQEQNPSPFFPMSMVEANEYAFYGGGGQVPHMAFSPGDVQHMAFSTAGPTVGSGSDMSPPHSMMPSPPQATVYYPAPAEHEMEIDMAMSYPQPHQPGIVPASLASPPRFIRPADLTPSPVPSLQYPSTNQLSPTLSSASVSPPAPVAFPAAHTYGSSSPPGLTGGESDYDASDDSGESEMEEPDADDADFVPRTRRGTRRRTRRTSATSDSAGDSGSPRRMARACKLRAPVPVPNLTKKSRGRRVPTAPVFVTQGGVQKNTRGYMCYVDDCKKCFARGEHLKRHVRSIHTNEKPHKCPVPGCGKDFSRHDNLGQHMRVHKGYTAGEDY